MNRSRGFTLVELLVVIAIITILASIVVPKVTGAINKSRATKALSEIKGAELAVTKMLADVDKQSIDKFFPPGKLAVAVNAIAGASSEDEMTAERVYSNIFYELLRRGKDAQEGLTNIHPALVLQDTVKRKLGSSYMDIAMDPWGTNPYFFYAGPMKGEDVYRFRCHREPGYVYTDDAKRVEDGKMRGNPGWDNYPQFPAPYDLPVYIFSYGGDEVSNQLVQNDVEITLTPEELDANEVGGDDINNWDSANGWSAYY